MKSVWTKIWIVFIVLWLVVLANYVSNEVMINKYEKGIYTENKLSWLGILEPYVAPYNQGNAHYQKGEYEQAIESYQKALLKNPPKKKECKIRINMALSKLAMIDFDNLTEDKIPEIIRQLEDAKAVLTEEGCAEEDGMGHSKDAQQLKEEIDQMIEMLKNPQSSGSDDDSQKEQEKDNENKDDSDEEEKDEIQQKLEEIQDESMKNRYSDIQDVENFDNFDFSFGDEPTW